MNSSARRIGPTFIFLIWNAFSKIADWVNHVEAHNGTNPLPALLHALSLTLDPAPPAARRAGP